MVEAVILVQSSRLEPMGPALLFCTHLQVGHLMDIAPTLYDAIGLPREQLCTYCWNGKELHR